MMLSRVWEFSDIATGQLIIGTIVRYLYSHNGSIEMGEKHRANRNDARSSLEQEVDKSIIIPSYYVSKDPLKVIVYFAMIVRLSF
jgi:hypothetical protein